MAKFEIYKSNSGKHHFRLKASNGQIVLSSQGYANKSGAKNGIESVRKNVGRDGGIERFEGKNGKHYFRVKATNGQTIASSQGYASASGLINGIKSVQTNAPEAELVIEVARTLLAEDTDDLRAIKERADEPTLSFEAFVQELKAEGTI